VAGHGIAGKNFDPDVHKICLSSAIPIPMSHQTVGFAFAEESYDPKKL